MTSSSPDLSPPRILVIDDEPQIHRFLGPALAASGYAPMQAENAATGLHLAATQSPAAVLLDLGLPDLDGQEAIPRLRAFCTAPIIVLSARDGEAAKVTALARLRAALRRVAAAAGQDAPAALIRIGQIEMDLAARTVMVNGAALKLTPREWDLLAALARAGAGRVVTQRQLLSAVWGPGHAESPQYLRVYIGHLRQKLGDAATLIRTEPGVGYRLGPAD